MENKKINEELNKKRFKNEILSKFKITSNGLNGKVSYTYNEGEYFLSLPTNSNIELIKSKDKTSISIRLYAKNFICPNIDIIIKNKVYKINYYKEIFKHNPFSTNFTIQSININYDILCDIVKYNGKIRVSCQDISNYVFVDYNKFYDAMKLYEIIN